MLKIFRLLLAFTFICSCSSAPPRRAQLITLIHTSRLIDGVSDSVLTNVDLIVINGRIDKIGPSLKAPAGAKVIDLTGYTVLPGLIDMHTHMTAAPEDNSDLKGHVFMSREQVLTRARKHASSTLHSGFTTVRDLGTYHGWANRDLRDEISRGVTPGPRMQVAPFYLTIPGGGGDVALPGFKGKLPAEIQLGVTRGPENFRARTRMAIEGGADLIKVIASGAVLAYTGEPGAPEMSRAELEAVVQEAHKAGRKVAAHAHGTRSIKDAILAGVDTIEHASLIDDEGLRLAKKRGVALAMDIYNGDYIDVEGVKQHWPARFLEKNKKITEIQRRNFAKAYRAGVPLVFATDAGVYPCGDNAKQFKIMTARGMKPMDAIKSATAVAARFMGWEKDIGSLAAGKFADLVAVKEDPLADIGALEHINVVIQGGKVVYRE